jgi:hypothetical protein
MAATLLEGFVLNRTWSIHCVSPAAKEEWSAEQERRGEDELERGATRYLRRQLQLRRRGVAPPRRGTARSHRKRDAEDDDDDDASNYATVQWIETRSSPINDGEGGSGKRKRGDVKNSGDEDNKDGIERHLYVEVWLSEAWSAAVLFCFAGEVGFECCLARGVKASYELIFAWMSALSGCRISTRPVQLSTAQLTRATARLTTVKKNGESAKPLHLTWAAPESVARAGLDALSITVPPGSVQQLLTVLRPATSKDEKKRKQDGDETIVSQLQGFIEGAFHMNVASFRLVKAASEQVTLSADGRCKPLSGHALSVVRGLLLRRGSELVDSRPTGARLVWRQEHRGDGVSAARDEA